MTHERLDMRASQIFLQGGSLMHGRSFWKCDEQYVGERWIAQPLRQMKHFLRLCAAGLALQLPLVRLAGIQQQQGVAGGRSVEHDEAVCSLSHLAGEGAEHCNLFGAGDRKSSSNRARPATSILAP